ncbi:MAG: DUF1499 domain-containing protein [Rhizobiaceae bacterium]
MTWLFRILTFIIGFAALLGVLFLIASTYGWEKIWESTFGPADMGAIQFEDFSKGPKPNQALICPEGICNEDSRDRVSPIYLLSVDELRSKFLKALETEQDLTRVDDKTDPLSLRFIQRTAKLRFPDTIRIQFYALGDSRSTIALYSQSQIGSSDLGVNRARLKRWLLRLQQFDDNQV